VLWPVAHRQIVLTIPKMLRVYFRYDRRLLGDLCRVAAGAITRSFRVLLEEPDSEPGLVVCVHSFGNLLNFHPHLHVMATDGGFTPEGVFHPLPTMSLARIEELFRHRVLGMLRRKGLLTPERIRLMRSWAHSGFNVNAQVRIGADDVTGRENLARYLIRAPFSMNKIRYDSAARTVIYKTKMVAGPNRNFEIFDPLDFLAAVTSHIPNRRSCLVGPLHQEGLRGRSPGVPGLRRCDADRRVHRGTAHRARHPRAPVAVGRSPATAGPARGAARTCRARVPALGGVIFTGRRGGGGLPRRSAHRGSACRRGLFSGSRPG